MNFFQKEGDGLLVHQIPIFYFVAIGNPVYFWYDLLASSLLLDVFAVIAHAAFYEPSKRLERIASILLVLEPLQIVCGF